MKITYIFSALTFAFTIMLLCVFITAIFIQIIPAKQQANIINEKFGTSYSTWDFVFAKDTIEKIIEGERKRIDITLKEETKK